jgi:hypothetical protein
MLTAANQPVGAVITAAGIADSDDSQILILIADFHACRVIVITAGKIQAKDGETG